MNKDRSMLTDAQWARLSPLLPGQEQSPGTTPAIRACSSRRCCGGPDAACRGATCPPSGSAPGTPGRPGFGAGARPACGRRGWPRCKTRRACTGLWWTRRPCGRTKWPLTRKKDSPVGQALGRSRGGFTPKCHLSCDAYGRICALVLTGGQAGDCPQAPGRLVRHLQAEQAVLADWAYDARYVRTHMQQAGATAVIPGKKNRLVPLEHDTEIYKQRNRIERTINGLKRFRAVATRFDKRAANYFATCCLIAALTWL